jgi:tetratricopeptide (TPR) repeat protein
MRRRHRPSEAAAFIRNRLENLFGPLEAMMKKTGLMVLVLSLVVGLMIPAALAQVTGQVKGVCKDVNGKPLAGATVQWDNLNTGRHYSLKTNNKGEYFSLGIDPGKYKVTLVQDGKEVFHYENFPVPLEGAELEINLQKEMQNQAKGAGLSPEELKQAQEAQAKMQKENASIKTLNDKLAAAKTAADGGDFDGAIAQMNEATQMDPNRDILWAKLGDYTRSSAPKQSDPAEKSKRYTDALDDYKKAIDLKQKANDTAKDKKPEDTQILAAYYNNMADAAAKSGKVDDAVQAYEQAAKINPAGSAGYYFNEGAVLTNVNKTDDAIAAFDKSIAADPTRADAYYWKGVALIGKATLKGDKMVAPDGTAEAFNKYLELQPTGPYADPSKQMLASIGASVQTDFGKKTGKPVKTK